jgi:hypothetical protein
VEFDWHVDRDITVAVLRSHLGVRAENPTELGQESFPVFPVVEAGLEIIDVKVRARVLSDEAPSGKYEVLADVKTQVGARTCALDAKTHNVLLVTATMKPAAKGGRPQPEPFVVLVVGR